MVKVLDNKLIIEIETGGNPFEFLSGLQSSLARVFMFCDTNNTGEAIDTMKWNIANLLTEITFTENQGQALDMVTKTGKLLKLQEAFQ